MNWDALLFQTFAPFIQWPLAAFVPAALFAALYYLKRRTAILVAALCWVGYATLETLNKARITCSGECDIRLDLLLIYPALWVVSIVALVMLFLPRKRRGAA
jgi:hypothetical protein